MTKVEHFLRFAGYEAKIDTMVPVEGRKRFKGKIIKVDEQNNVHFEMDGNTYVIPFDDISKAKLVLTDELLNAYMEANPDVEL